MANICIFGGSGFIGRHLAERLVEDGHCVTVPTRRRERAKHLFMLPTADVIEADIHDPARLNALLRGCDIAVNLVGILHSRRGRPYGPDFARVHVELPRKIAAACRERGVGRLLHVSALKAAPDAPSAYLRSKGDGEAVVFGARGNLAISIFRPSVVFGPEDRFMNTFAAVQRRLPLMVLACPDAKFQPVYVGDVVEAMARSLDDEASYGHAYDLAGPKVYSLSELVRCAGEWSGHPRPILPLGKSASFMQAAIMEMLPGKLLTRDNYHSMQVDSVSAAPLPFGIKPTALEAVAPAYLNPTGPRTRYSGFRNLAGRRSSVG